jgi:hypothetical protein
MELLVGDNVDTYSFEMDDGAIAFITYDQVEPDTAQQIKMKIGTLNDIGVRRTNIKRVFTPKSDCKDFNQFSFDRTLFTILTQNFTYTQDQCFSLCIQRTINAKCNCSDLRFMDLKPNQDHCLKSSQLSCSNAAYSKLIESDFQEECTSFCPLECETNKLDFAVSTSRFPNPQYANEILIYLDVIDKSFTIDNTTDIQYLLEKNTLAINVYYNDLEYTQVEEERANDIVDFFTSLGGNIGLFIGVSILSVFEIMEFLVEAFIIVYSALKVKMSSKKPPVVNHGQIVTKI